MAPPAHEAHYPHPQPLPTRERFRGPPDQIVVTIQILTSVRRNKRSSRLHIGSIWLWNADCLTFPAIMAHLPIHRRPSLPGVPTVPHSRAGHQTTNLGVGGSNPSGRASKINVLAAISERAASQKCVWGDAWGNIKQETAVAYRRAPWGDHLGRHRVASGRFQDG
jgi:hypothetical protein